MMVVETISISALTDTSIDHSISYPKQKYFCAGEEKWVPKGGDDDDDDSRPHFMLPRFILLLLSPVDVSMIVRCLHWPCLQQFAAEDE